ncbi:rod-binding protein [Paucidesulfovibrio longus]|uniref:rod-binding protein n=1 Tax=Paucidesulfovibrio longus TaxID=889 RepID=UPI0003B51664|nr:rod-binding protein [Paucidesulfovibrio longus]
MTGIGDIAAMDVQMANAKASDQELIRYKQRMDSLKQRLQGAPDKEQQLQKACRDFEAVFIGKLWEQMRKTVPKGEMHSQQEDMYLSMFDRAFSEQMADSGGIGLSKMLYDQLAARLKTTSGETLPGNAEIKPLARNGKPDIKTLEEAALDTRLDRGPEPATPPETSAPLEAGEMSVGGGEAPADAGVKQGETSAAGLGSLSQAEVDSRLDRLARDIGMRRTANPGRILAHYK